MPRVHLEAQHLERFPLRCVVVDGVDDVGVVDARHAVDLKKDVAGAHPMRIERVEPADRRHFDTGFAAAIDECDASVWRVSESDSEQLSPLWPRRHVFRRNQRHARRRGLLVAIDWCGKRSRLCRRSRASLALHLLCAAQPQLRTQLIILNVALDIVNCASARRTARLLLGLRAAPRPNASVAKVVLAARDAAADDRVVANAARRHFHVRVLTVCV